MGIPYTEFRYFYPPRTDVKLPFDMKGPVLSVWARMPDAIAQYKLNGSRNLVVISPEDEIAFWNRHGETQRRYVIPAALVTQIRQLSYPRGKWNIFDSELMHFKTPQIKNSVYFFDTLVWGGEHLLNSTYADRYSLVKNLRDWDSFSLDSGCHSGKIWLAKNLNPDTWQSAWTSALKDTAVEGLVLKRTGPISRLKPDKGREVNNGEFMCRVRKPFKNAQF